ncbi:hypothetical protein K438DRAFT_1771164 [Mycena galopus ATCC 62051]|nr:hypothetical protein K438DRAFT_1771164 [Mycena galopus ATCC 62051]
MATDRSFRLIRAGTAQIREYARAATNLSSCYSKCGWQEQFLVVVWTIVHKAFLLFLFEDLGAPREDNLLYAAKEERDTAAPAAASKLNGSSNLDVAEDRLNSDVPAWARGRKAPAFWLG